MKIIGKLRKWQTEAMQQGRSSQHFLRQAPGGSGKSLIQVMLGTADIRDYGHKQLVVVPQSHIHHSFYDEDRIRFTLPGDTSPSDWTVACNPCDNGRNDVVGQLRSWLLCDANELKDSGCLAAISTHTALVACWSRLSPKEKRKALSKITFRIDEAHHISNVFHEADIGDAAFEVASQQATRLGQFVGEVLRADQPTAKLHLTSATFFRGDRKTILSSPSYGVARRFSRDYRRWSDVSPMISVLDRPQGDVVEIRGGGSLSESSRKTILVLSEERGIDGVSATLRATQRQTETEADLLGPGRIRTHPKRIPAAPRGLPGRTGP